MFTNFYDKAKKFIKEYYKSILFLLVIYIIFMLPLNYYIVTGGGIMEVGNRIEVKNSNKAKGSFNLAYVREVKGTTATYLLSYIMPDWKRIKVSDYTYDNKEDIQDVNFRSAIDLLNANDNAIKNAYLKANKSYEVIDRSLYVYYIEKNRNNGLKVGDQILELNGEKVNDLKEFKNKISVCHENDQIEILVKRNKKNKKIKTTVYKKDNQLLIGIYVNAINTYKTNPNVKIKFKNGESGPSGGIIETLDIYNKLTKKDITKGLKIAGTGEIDSDGNVSSIGEVKYKLLGAAKKKADVFIVPKGENYEECKKVQKEKHLKIKIIGVETFEEALTKLERLKK